MEYFRKGRAAWPQVLVAERTFAQLSEDYIAALIELRDAEVDIQGLLLVDGLTQPPEPTPQGHIEATPTPR
jgi:cobalt-zinc-cadmium efflux system outer membrane protein